MRCASASALGCGVDTAVSVRSRPACRAAVHQPMAPPQSCPTRSKRSQASVSVSMGSPIFDWFSTPVNPPSSRSPANPGTRKLRARVAPCRSECGAQGVRWPAAYARTWPFRSHLAGDGTENLDDGGRRQCWGDNHPVAVQKRGRGVVLQYEPRGPGLQRPEVVLVEVEGREREDAGGSAEPRRPGSRHSVQPRHTHIHYHRLGVQAHGQLHCGLLVGGLGDDQEIGLDVDHHAHADRRQLLTVGEQHGDGHGFHAPAGWGRVASTRQLWRPSRATGGPAAAARHERPRAGVQFLQSLGLVGRAAAVGRIRLRAASASATRRRGLRKGSAMP